MDASFSKMIYADLVSECLALLKATEEKHKLIYIEAPRLEKIYMNSIGEFEAQVLEAEVEAELVRQKIEMIQACINRREPINMEEIEEAIAAKRQEMIKQINSSSGSNFVIEDEAQNEELQKLYNEILQEFHPELNPDITAVQRELYNRAVEAYKAQDLESMRLIYNMLFEERIEIPISFELQGTELASDSDGLSKLVEKHSTDYRLAEMIYPYCKPFNDDGIMKSESEKYRSELNATLDEIQGIKSRFPFSAIDVITDDNKKNEYMDNLKYRLLKAQNDKKELEQRVNEMVGVSNG